MFSPSQLIQSLVQRAPAAAPKPVELTPGQVFKGTVVRQYPDNMALVQIGGMQVQAKLEARLEQGQKAWLQVQPATDVVTLKVLDASVEGTGKEASLEGLIRSLGLSETKESRTIVTALMNAHLPINKDIVQAFAAVATRLGGDEATVEAFMMAVKRNLPLTPDTVAGLKAFLSEKPISQVIQNFLQQASLFLDEEAGVPGQASESRTEGRQGQANGPLRQLVTTLREKVAALPLTLAQAAAGEQQTPATQTPNTASGSRGDAAPGGQSAARGGNGAAAAATASHLTQSADAIVRGETEAVKPSAGAPNGQTPASAAQPSHTGASELQQQPQTGRAPASAGSVPAGAAPMANQGAQLFAEAGRAAAGSLPAAPAVAAESAVPAAQAGGQQQMPHIAAVRSGALAEAGLTQQGAGAMASQPLQSTAASSPAGPHPLQELFRQLGMAHERELMGQALPGAVADTGLHKQMESVKSMLLQITQSQAHNLPAALREAADQLLQQVTGQQLMLLQPTNQAMSQLVMQIPIRTGQGEDTAYVQIESKKKGGGQVDAENCRLFFHLDLQMMGTTMIDVNIVNRIINLQIFNDTPWVEGLVQGRKEGFAEQLQEAGYHLSAVRVQSIPEQRTKTTVVGGAKGAILSDYKGVDLRV